jgi:hypothetical protein
MLLMTALCTCKSANFCLSLHGPHGEVAQYLPCPALVFGKVNLKNSIWGLNLAVPFFLP